MDARILEIAWDISIAVLFVLATAQIISDTMRSKMKVHFALYAGIAAVVVILFTVARMIFGDNSVSLRTMIALPLIVVVAINYFGIYFINRALIRSS